MIKVPSGTFINSNDFHSKNASPNSSLFNLRQNEKAILSHPFSDEDNTPTCSIYDKTKELFYHILVL